MADMQAAPATDSAAAAAPTTGGGFVIEIYVMPDGTMSVMSKPLAEEIEAEGEEAGKGQVVKSFGEALKVALGLYQAGGSTGDDEFSEGYGSTAPQTEDTVSMEPSADLGAR